MLSCQKTLNFADEPVLPLPPTQPIADTSDYLEKIFYIDSLAGVNDTTQITQYLFDSSKRVAGQIIYQNNLLASIINYYYQGMDTLPFKTMEVNVENGMPHPQHNDTIQKFYRYIAGGANLYDSALYYVHNINNGQLVYQLEKTVNNYQYVTGKIFRFTSKQILESNVPANMQPAYSVDTAELDIHNNVVLHKHYSILPGGGSQFTNLYTYTYDNKFSPLSNLTSRKTLDPLTYSIRNNKLKIHYEFQGGTLDDDFTGRYIYKTNGFPSRLVYPSGSIYYRIENYVYKSF